MITTPDFIAKYPNTVIAVVSAELLALHHAKSHSADEIAGHMPSAFKGGEPQIYASALAKNLDTFTAEGRLPTGAAERTLDNLKLVVPDLPAASIDLSKTYDDSFLNRVARSR